jgi:YVTN family beta-propeller protein
MKKIIVISCLLLCCTMGFSQFKISKTIDVAGDGGWDYLSVDELSQHLFVSHGTEVNVIDLKTDTVIATIPNTNGVHGIAINNDLNEAYISNGKDNTITIINLKSFELIEIVKIEGIKPDCILYDKFSNKVFVYNGKSNDCFVLDAVTHKILKTIALGGKPEFSVTNNKGTIYVNIETTNEIKVIDATKLEVIKTFAIAPGEEPTGLTMDLKTNRLFSVCSNKMMQVVDADNGKIINSIPIGEGCDGVSFDPKKKLIFTANGEGTITIIKEENKNKYSVVQTLATKKGARTITINKSTGKVYTSTPEFGGKPEPTTENPKPRPAIIPNSFKVLVIER